MEKTLYNLYLCLPRSASMPWIVTRDGCRVYQTKPNTSMMRSLTVVFPPNKVLRSWLKANLCCRVIPRCREEYCCSRAQDEFRDSREAREASREASGTRPAWLESHSILGWTDVVQFSELILSLSCLATSLSVDHWVSYIFFQAALYLKDTKKESNCIPGDVIQTVYGLWRSTAVYSHLNIQSDWRQQHRK